MIKRIQYLKCLSIAILLLFGINIQFGYSQNSSIIVKGTVIESGSGLPLKQISVLVPATGVSTETNEKGEYSIQVSDKNQELIFYYPGFNRRSVFILGRDMVNVTMVESDYKTFDNSYNVPLGSVTLKDATYSVSAITATDINYSRSASFDNTLQGKAAGLAITEQSGMPGSKAWINLQGISSIYAKNNPVLFIDGMIHDYNYANRGLMQGFSLNPMDIVDVEDIADVSVIKTGNAYLGSIASNGVINVNTEQKSEASTIIKLSAYSGVSSTPASLDLLNPTQYKNYLNEMGASTSLPWVKDGDNSVKDYYKYNQNNTDWQKEIFKPGIYQKYYIFLKGGDDIATYNMSSGFISQDGLYKGSGYSRFNLRVNGKINITNKFSVTPNAKLSLSDAFLPNMGYSDFKNPLLSAVLSAPSAGIYARDPKTGVELPFLDNTGDVNVSNPDAIIKDATGNNRNYHFLSSVNIQYKINPNLVFSNLIGINFNNAREKIFLPDYGLIQVDSAKNSPQEFTNEFRSTQNHASLTYTNKNLSGHKLEATAGMRYMRNTYKVNEVIDLNTPSDQFKTLGRGSYLQYLRTTSGLNRGLLWVSYFANANYSINDKYFLNVNMSYDGNSAISKFHRYNTYPSVGVAWRLSEEDFLSGIDMIEELKFRGSWSQSGNMYSNIYDNSKLYYSSGRLDRMGVVFRNGIPNPNMEIEKKTTMNFGFDLSLFKQKTNLHFDIYNSDVNNLIMQQNLDYSAGFDSSYFNNGGKLTNLGIEISADQRFNIGKLVWLNSFTFAFQKNKITALRFLSPNSVGIVTKAQGAEYITSLNNPINAFYGYKTRGLISAVDTLTGPKGIKMTQGDVKYIDMPGADGKTDSIINEFDKTMIGDPNPDFFGSFSSSIRFKGFELSANFFFSIGNDAFNYVKYRGEMMSTYSNQFKTVLNRWTPTNKNGTLPNGSFGDPHGNNAFSDRFIEDGSYVRLKQLTLNYTLPTAKNYKGITIYVTATNLFTFTKYSGYDPEFMYMGNPFTMGIDYGSMPQVKSVILGLKLDL